MTTTLADPGCIDCGWQPAPGERWPSEGRRAVRWMERFLICAEGDWYGKPIRLRTDQKRFVWRWYEFCPRCGYWHYDTAVRGAATGDGKALALDTPIPTPAGWTTMGGLASGDEVFTESGEVARVTYVSPVYTGRDCYEVLFSDGERIVADAEHLWVTEHHLSHGYERSVKTTAQIAATLRRPDGHGFNHRLPMPGPIALPDAALPVDPYILGSWLGDGAALDARWTMHETDLPEFREQVELAGYHVLTVGRDKRRPAVLRVQVSTQARKGSWRGGVPSLKGQLRAIGVLGDKHVPAPYLRGSEKQRLALLQGLMDTDGSVSARGQCEFCTTREPLALAVAELLASLGIKYRLVEGRARIGVKDCGPKWRVIFEPTEMAVFRLTRKQARIKRRGRIAPMSETRRIVDVRPVPSVPVRCIQVDHPSRLYLAGRRMVQTHNTTFVAGLECLELFGPPQIAPVSPNIINAAASFEQADLLFGIAGIMLGGRDQAVREAPLCGYAEVYDTEIRRVDGVPGVMRRVAAVAGTNEGGLPSLFVCDEVHEWGDVGDRKARVHMVIGKSTKKRRLVCRIPGDDGEIREVTRGPGRILNISTAGFDVDHSLLGAMYKHGKRAERDVGLAPRLLFDWHEAPDGLDYGRPEDRRRAVTAASDAAGVLWDVEARVREYDKPEVQRHEWIRYYANRWVDVADESWLSDHPAAWGACQGTWELAGDEPTVLAVDMALRRDSVAVGEFAQLHDGRTACTWRIWYPADGKIDHLEVWEHIRARAAALGGRYRGTVYDPRFFELPARQLEEEGLLVIEFSQSPQQMAPACGLAFDAIIHGKLVHDGDVEASRQIRGAVKRVQERGFTLSKPKSRVHIDAAVTLAMGLDALARLTAPVNLVNTVW